jgi:UDP-glucose 4-epimerase
VKEATGVKFETEKGEERKGEYGEVYADITKAKKILGWQPKKTMKDSVESLVAWYKRKPDGWKK